MQKTNFCVVGMLWCEVAAWEQGGAGAPAFKVVPVESSIKFGVLASVKIEVTFDKWDAS